ncbi:DegT/DnrJ/EryC1/StrS family aminotransferase [Candidatus Avelusimicrobium fimicolum]|uniref:DegT/DnrJ/EryC1/StrS family aminotransferase n=1 Tax=Candidatus Avelusimicrobium fimicolum TaxID=3416216 RepID=UPI003D0B8B1B
MITKEAKNIKNAQFHRVYFNSARAAFLSLLNAVCTDCKDTILMPAYIGQSVKEGSGVFDPVRTLRIPYQFYNLQENLQVDMVDFIKKIQNPHIRAVFLIHYFGFPQENIVSIKKICQQKGILLIEDCAHSLYSCLNGRPIGQFGDFALFSIHKFLPSKAGGFLLLNNKISVEASHPIALEDLTIFANASQRDVMAKRCQNYKYYLDHYNKYSSLYRPMLPALPAGVIPLNFPIFITGIPREKVYFELQKKKIITVALWYKLIDEIPQSVYPHLYNLSNHILNLPVHQDISLQEITQILQALNDLEGQLCH